VTKRNLIIIHRGYNRDFDEIATKVNALDRDITVYHLSNGLLVELPSGAWQYPTLTVSSSARFKIPVKRGPILKNYAIGKLAQQEIFRKHNIPTPPALPFRFGMKLDPILFGNYVLLKPGDLTVTSHGNLVFLFRRSRLSNLTETDLPPNHPVRRNAGSFIVQRYIHTGPRPRCTRVGTFLGRVIFSYEIEPLQQLPSLDADNELLELASVASNSGERERRLVSEIDVFQLAEAAHAAVGPLPLLGIDIIRDSVTKKLYVLEVNAGGNTWHFSSSMGKETRISLGNLSGPEADPDSRGRLALIEQLGAFDIVATRLVEKTQELAS
jgi:hypothetical protein